ncbi:MAG: hypothetical protein BIFFINMI_02700 [Phycisphaerae bacterium]|nr:hypothetical protein [Phycisphaerae bacterium]
MAEKIGQAIGQKLADGVAASQTTDRPATGKVGRWKEHEKAVLRSWTQADLDSVIRQYKAKRAASYADLVSGVKAGRPGAKKAATAVFGRNAIVRALGVRSPIMVSRSPTWIEIAEELGFPLARNRRAKGTRHTAKAGRIGHDIAIEAASESPAEGADNARPEAQLESAERQETIRQIKRLAQSGKSAKQKADRRAAAEDLYAKLQRGEVSDEAARQTVQMTLGPEDLPLVADDLNRLRGANQNPDV